MPPQPYLAVVEKLGYDGSYGAFLLRYFAADHGFCIDGKCLTLPTWNHLWFLPYLWVYTMLLLGLARWAGPRWAEATSWQALTRGARLLWLPCLLFALLRITLFPHFPSKHKLTGDWYNHALYGAMFVLGFALFGHRDDRHGAWAAAVRWRWWALGVAVLAHFAAAIYLRPFDHWAQVPESMVAPLRAASALRQWLPIIAILGFARRHLSGRDGPWRRVLTEAVFPAYIVHQTVIVVAGHHLPRLGWPQPIEAAALIGLTVAGCTAGYLLARRIGWLRPWMGLQARGPSRAE